MSRDRGVFPRGQVTDWLLAQLTDRLQGGTRILVGDHVAPRAGGWAGGMPGSGEFTPYIVLTTGEASRNSAMTLGQSVADDWNVQYSVRSVGGVRSECDWTADAARYAWISLIRQVLDLQAMWSSSAVDRWQLYQADVLRMGAITRNDTTDPPYWELVDSFAVNLTRART